MNPFRKGSAVRNLSFGNGFIVEADPNKDWCGVDFFDEETGTIVRRGVSCTSLFLLNREEVAFPRWAVAESSSGKERFWRMRAFNAPRGPITHELKFAQLGYVKPAFAKKALDYAYHLVFEKGWRGDPADDPNAVQKKKTELFCNVFLGKLGHCAVYQCLSERKDPNGEPYMVSGFDAFMGFTVNKYQDLMVNCKPTLIRATKSTRQLLLLPKYDWDNKLEYRKNRQRYVFIFLARIENDPETILKSKGLLSRENLSLDEIERALFDVVFFYDIPGFITRHDLIFLAGNGFSVHKGNGYANLFCVDSDSWYCQCHDMRPLRSFGP